MDRTGLVQALRRAQVPDALYDIPGVHDVVVAPDAYYVLRPDSGGWIVGVRERSRDSVVRRFTTEDEACRYLYVALTSRPSPVPGAAERVGDVLAGRDEIQRRAWESFERAGREHDAPGEQPPR